MSAAVALGEDRIAADEAAELFCAYENEPILAIACSGGRDSLALAWLFGQWRRDRHEGGLTAPELVLLSVDHRLRPDSAADLDHVAALARQWRLPHHRLAVRSLPPGNRQDMARRGRYALMAVWCARYRVPILLTAHHRDDQAETVMMRLLRGSGVEALAAIAPHQYLHSAAAAIRLERPILAIARQRLTATLQAASLSWRDDQSNRDRRFSRVKLRDYVSTLDPTNAALTQRRLAGLADRARAASFVLDEAMRGAARRAIVISHAGYARLDRMAWRGLDPDITYRLLAAVLRLIGSGVYAPRAASLCRLDAKLRDPHALCAVTLGGCFIAPWGDDFEMVVIGREWGRRPMSRCRLEPGSGAIWDRRFRLCLATPPAMIVTPPPMTVIRRCLADIPALKLWPQPARLLQTLPALYIGDELVAIPHLGFYCLPELAARISVETLAVTALMDVPGNHHAALHGIMV